MTVLIMANADVTRRELLEIAVVTNTLVSCCADPNIWRSQSSMFATFVADFTSQARKLREQKAAAG